MNNETPFAGEPVTIKINNYNQSKDLGSPLKLGQIIKWKESKRIRFRITDVKRQIDSFNYTFTKVYKPAPKSRLKNKTKFSKVKMEIIK